MSTPPNRNAKDLRSQTPRVTCLYHHDEEVMDKPQERTRGLQTESNSEDQQLHQDEVQKKQRKGGIISNSGGNPNCGRSCGAGWNVRRGEYRKQQ